MVGHRSEQVTFERFNFDTFLDPLVSGADIYDPNTIFAHLRTEHYDLQLVTGAALLPGEAQYNPHEDVDGYGERWDHNLRVRQRIENDPGFSMRILLGEAALRQVLGTSIESLSPKELTERQAAAVDSVAADVNGGYQIGIVPFTADTRSVSTGRCMVVHAKSGADLMAAGMRRGDFIEARMGDSEAANNRVERAKIAFKNLWEASVTEPEEVVAYLGDIAHNLRTSTPGTL